MNYIKVNPDYFKNLKYEVIIPVLPERCCCGYSNCIDPECI